jgi:hypothetical protein
LILGRIRFRGGIKMTLKQVSVFVQNKPGRLSKVTHTLGGKGINIRALSMAEVGDFGIIRMIVEDTDGAIGALKEGGITAKVTEVIGIEMENRPGGLARIADVLGDGGVNIEYAYAFVTKDRDKAVLITRVDEKEKAEEILKEAGIRTISPQDVASI